jgi:hypothetical protein
MIKSVNYLKAIQPELSFAGKAMAVRLLKTASKPTSAKASGVDEGYNFRKCRIWYIFFYKCE